jgi:cell division protease FtsH
VKQQHKTLIVWLVFILIVVTIWVAFARPGERVGEKKFAELVAQIESGEVKELEIQETAKGWVFTGEYKENKGKFVSLGMMNDGVSEALQTAYGSHGTLYDIKPREQGGIWIVLLQWLPMLLIIVFFVFFMRQLQSGGGKAMSFGKSRARLVNESQNKVTFEDVAGVEESKVELEEIVHFLKDPKKFTRLGGRIPKGVMLMGPPGTGKTLLARAIAGEAGVPFFSIAGSDFVEMFVGVGASRVRDLFEQGKKNAPCIIFIDEIDAVGRHRGAGMGGGHDEREQTLNQLLVEMDGFESNEGVIIIAATNRPDVLDPAILRPGRFDRRVTVPRPDVMGRQQIFQVHTRKVPCSADVDMEILARATPGMSGADIENLVNEAALIAARKDKNKVGHEDFEAARDKVLMGTERRSMVMGQKDLETTAYHEAGHALVTELLTSDVDPVHKVTIIPRGAALGLTMRLPDDRVTYSKKYAENLIAILMGGRIAEELIFGEYNTGAADDIDKATDLARKMVTQWGMSEKMGPLSFGRKEQEVFLGREMAQHQDYSEKTAQEIDTEVRRIVHEEYQRARRLLEENKEMLHHISKALLEYETLDMRDIETLMKGDSLTRKKPPSRIRTKESLEAERAERDKPKGDEEKPALGGIGDPMPEPGGA